MSGKRQNNQLKLAFAAGGMGEAPETASEGTEPRAATRTTERPADTEQLMDAARVRAQPDRTAVYGPVRTVVWEG